MPRWLRYTLYGLVAFTLLLALFVSVAVTLVNPNDFKPRIVALVQESKQRTLTPRGDLKVTLFPRLGIEMNDVRLSERRSSREFASVKRVRFFLAWWPLLRKEFVVDGVRIEGLAVHLKRYPDGKTNFDDLLHSQNKSTLLAFAIDSVKVVGAAVTFDDVGARRAFVLSHIKLDTGPLANRTRSRMRGSFDLGINQPQGAASGVFTAVLDMDLAAKRYRLSNFSLSLKGTQGAFADVSARLMGNAEFDGLAKTVLARPLTLDMTVPVFGVRSDLRMAADVVRRTAEFEVKDATASMIIPAPNRRLAITAALKRIENARGVTAFSPLSFAVDGQARNRRYRATGAGTVAAVTSSRVALRDLRVRLDLALPGTLVKNVRADVTAAADLDPQARHGELRFNGAFDQSRLVAVFNVRGSQPLALTFDVQLDRLDLNRYKANTPSSTPLDFSVLQTLERMNADGRIRVGTLVVGQTVAHNAMLQAGAPIGSVKP